MFAPWFAKAPNIPADKAIVIGAGIAGCCIADALSQRGVEVVLIDRNQGPAQGASSNPAALLMPALACDHARNAFSQFVLQSYLYSIEQAKILSQDYEFEFKNTGVVQLAFNQRQALRQQKWQKIADYSDLIEYLTLTQVQALTSLNFSQPGVLFKQAVCLNPHLYSQAYLNRAKQQGKVSEVYNCFINLIDYQNHCWQVYNQNNELIAQAPLLILANAIEASTLLQNYQLPLEIRRVRGQISALKNHQLLKQLKCPVSYDGYLSPCLQDGIQWLGATFDTVNSNNCDASSESRLYNLTQLAKVLPEFKPNVKAEDLDLNQESVGIRSIVSDYLPLVGPVPDVPYYHKNYANLKQDRRHDRYQQACYLPGLYLTIGHGSRGMITAPFAADLIMREIYGEPLALTAAVRAATHVGRFLIRRLKKQGAV